MAETVFSLRGEWTAALSAAPAGGEGPAGAPRQLRIINGRWRSASGEPLSDPFPLQPSTGARIEYAEGDGAFTSARTEPALSFAADIPHGAAALEISADNIPIQEIAIGALGAERAPLPAPSVHRIGNPGAKLAVPVFAERFTDEPRFIALVAQLHDWILAQPPFDQPPIGAALAFDAHFWASDPVHGLFDTGDEKNDHERLFYGDRELARRLLAPWTGHGVSLILIDSNLRGGAGGQPGYSAWTSVAGKAGECWEAVCLHEVGHGFGLADEYLDSQREHEWPGNLEPNVSQQSRPSQTSWATLKTVGDVPAPTGAIDAAAPSGTIGTFQGARYRSDLYRPSPNCLMRQTTQPFCGVCQAAILAQLKG